MRVPEERVDQVRQALSANPIIEFAEPDLLLGPALVPGWNYVDNTPDTADGDGHRTGVAGAAAAASNNGLGVAAAAWNCKLMLIFFLRGPRVLRFKKD